MYNDNKAKSSFQLESIRYSNESIKNQPQFISRYLERCCIGASNKVLTDAQRSGPKSRRGVGALLIRNGAMGVTLSSNNPPHTMTHVGLVSCNMQSDMKDDSTYADPWIN